MRKFYEGFYRRIKNKIEFNCGLKTKIIIKV